MLEQSSYSQVGIARTDWERDLADGNYYTDSYDLALAGYFWAWDPLTSAFDDSDGWHEDVISKHVLKGHCPPRLGRESGRP